MFIRLRICDNTTFTRTSHLSNANATEWNVNSALTLLNLLALLQILLYFIFRDCVINLLSMATIAILVSNNIILTCLIFIFTFIYGTLHYEVWFYLLEFHTGYLEFTEYWKQQDYNSKKCSLSSQIIGRVHKNRNAHISFHYRCNKYG